MHVAFVMFLDSQMKIKQTLASQLAKQEQKQVKVELLKGYWCHHHVFSEKESQHFPGPHIWDHAIELKEGAPSTLPGKIYPLMQVKQRTLEEFIQEHSKKGYIQPLKSPYALPFFFIKKKDEKL